MKLLGNRKSRSRVAGMTLVEVVVAASLGVVVLGMSTWFTFEVMRASYSAMTDTENGIQQWAISAKLQIDGKIANGATIFESANKTVPEYLVEVPMDNGVVGDGLERGNVLVLSKSVVDSAGTTTNVVSEVVFYLYTPGYAPTYGTLKRYPAKAPDTFKVTTPYDASSQPKTVRTIVDENITMLLAGAEVVQKNVVSLATGYGPFAHFGNPNNVSIALLRIETTGSVKRSNLTEISFNLR